jgi:hypothetical protein
MGIIYLLNTSNDLTFAQIYWGSNGFMYIQTYQNVRQHRNLAVDLTEFYSQAVLPISLILFRSREATKISST